ncbi:MAG TPA: hypothetical protein VOA88_02270 [Candidatus Dormibacteraeota bacterium]|nr:hypothetical protein [Candidatus Dormibacteraeota bacterium]
MKKSNRINRQRRLQKQLQILLLERHSRRCIICHHPEREAIEEEFVHWRSPSRLAHDYKLGDYRTIYRHARAAGLLLQRRERLHSALDAFVESVDDVTFTGDTILRAMRAYSCIDSHGRWTEIPTQVQFSTSHDGHSPQPPTRTSNVDSDVIDIDSDDESEEDADNAPEKRVTALDVLNVIRKYSNQALRSDATACAVSPAQALPREVVRGHNPNDRSPSDRTDCAASPRPSRGIPAQPAAPQKPKPDADGLTWHPHPGYPNQEMSEPDAQGRVRYKIHMTTAASQLPVRETDAQRAAKLIYGSVIKKYGNP